MIVSGAEAGNLSDPSDKSMPSTKPFVIPVFIPHAGCPHRCIFCNQTQTTGRTEAFPTADQLHATIQQFLNYRRDPRRVTEISFYGGNFLGMPPERIRFLLTLGAGYVSIGMVHGLRFSTRPDTITRQVVDLLADFPLTTVELGVQSMNDTALALSRRGHTARHTREAVALLRSTPYRLGLQMMVGLPGDTPEQALTTARQMAELKPDFVRIYPTLVLKDSALARWYALGRYTPMTLSDSVDLVKTLYSLFARENITVIRMGLQPTGDLAPGAGVVAGPFHPAFGELVHSALWYEALARCLTRNKLWGGSIEISVQPSILSKLKGLKKTNLDSLRREFQLSGIRIHMDHDLPLQTVRVNGHACPLFPWDQIS